MKDAIGELKTRAELLHKKIGQGDPAALARLRVVPQFRKAPPEALEAAAPGIRYGDCLQVVAAELGFSGWAPAKAILSGEPGDGDYGTMLCPRRCSAHTNLWYRDYDEAAAVRVEKNGYLLAYKRQFLVVDEHYLESLRVPAANPAWESMGRDWVRPRNLEARAQLYAEIVAQLPREGRAE